MKKKATGTREWAKTTYNIQKGCTNNCRYCVDPNTLILMTDGTELPISQIEKGDRIVGVRKKNRRHHFVESVVKDIWTTKKKRFTIYLKNGVELKCSSDHRWLTERGWRKTATQRGDGRYRSLLSKSNRISSFGHVYKTPEDTFYYKQGYVYGAIAGDGTHGVYVYGQSHNRVKRFKRGRGHKKVTPFRLSNIDREIGDTTHSFLKDVLGISTTKVPFDGDMYSIRTGKKADHRKISFFLTRFNPSPKNHVTHPLRKYERARGFLAGIFDAEGSSGNNTIRISNTNEKILKHIEDALDILRFDHVRDRPNKKTESVRIKGGRSEYIRFFSVVHPRIKRKFKLIGKMCKNSSNVIRVGRASKQKHLLYDIETTTGNFIADGCIAHNCYAAESALRYGRISERDQWPETKINMDKVKKKWRKKQGTIMFPSTHDITPENLPECIQTIGNILEGGNHLLIVSKPHFRCIADICQSFRQYKDQILFRFTIGSMDSTNCLSFWEPGAPSFEERLGSLTYAFNAGYRTSVSSEPFLDDKVIDLFFKVEPYVTDSVWIGPMNKMEQRVDRTGWDKGSMHYWDLVKGSQTRAEIEIIYGALKDEPHVRWKDAIKDMLGLEKPTEVGMDI